MSLTEETKWVLVVTIVVSNIVFLWLWVYYFFKDVRLLMAKKMVKMFRLCCLCCRFKQLEQSRLTILKSEQDAEIVNEIENLETGGFTLIIDFGLVKDKYIWERKFPDKWEFEDFLRKTQRELNDLDTNKVKRKDYRKIHALKDSQARCAKEELKREEYELEFERQRTIRKLSSRNKFNAEMISPDQIDLAEVQPTLMVKEPNEGMSD